MLGSVRGAVALRNISLNRTLFKPQNVIQEFAVPNHKPYCEGIDKFILAINDERRSKVIYETLLYVNPYRMKEIQQLSKDYLIRYRDRFENVQVAQKESDPELRELITEEILESDSILTELEEEIYDALTDFDQLEAEKAIITIEAGAGGSEAAMFAGEIFDHYVRFLEYMGFDYNILSRVDCEAGSSIANSALNEVTWEVSGDNVFQRFLAEAGVHRVARIPVNSKRLQTSTVAVKVYPKRNRTKVKLDRSELEISSVRGAGKGGQKINTAHLRAVVRHKPSGKCATFFESGREHTLASNTETAIEMLEEMLQEEENAKFEEETLGYRNSMKTNYERGERMRNYSWQNKLVSDYNTKLKFNLDKYFSPNDGMAIMDEIQTEFIQIKKEQRNRALFKKYQKEIEPDDVKFIVSRSLLSPNYANAP